MDGTLIDSSKSITKSINYVRSHIGLPPIDKSIVTKNINLPDSNLPKVFYQTDTYKEEHRKLFMEHYQAECIKNIKVYDNIPEVLEKLSKDFIMSVATNASNFFAKKMLAHLGIEHYFLTVIGRNDVTNVKPHPEIVYKILQATGTAKENTLLVGDSQKDELTAKNAEIDFIYVKWGFGESIYNPQSVENADELVEKIYLKFNGSLTHT